jgi:hypothetical protein
MAPFGNTQLQIPFSKFNGTGSKLKLTPIQRVASIRQSKNVRVLALGDLDDRLGLLWGSGYLTLWDQRPNRNIVHR